MHSHESRLGLLHVWQCTCENSASQHDCLAFFIIYTMIKYYLSLLFNDLGKTQCKICFLQNYCILMLIICKKNHVYHRLLFSWLFKTFRMPYYYVSKCTNIKLVSFFKFLSATFTFVSRWYVFCYNCHTI